MTMILIFLRVLTYNNTVVGKIAKIKKKLKDNTGTPLKQLIKKMNFQDPIVHSDWSIK